MKKKVVLIDANGRWLKSDEGQTEQVVLPLGLMYLASYLEQQDPEVETKIYNPLVDIDDTPLEEIIREEQPNIIGIRGLTRYRKNFHDTARIARNNSNALIVGGGPHVLSDLDDALEAPIDIAVLGEGELTFAEIVAGKTPKESINGIAFKKEGSIVKTTPRNPIEDLDSLPFPNMNLIDMDKYAKSLNYGYNFRKQGVVYTSRGCGFKCDFCHVLFGKEPKLRSAENVVEEISRLKERGIDDIFVVDDIFNVNRRRAMDIFRKISASTLDIRIYFVNGLRGDLVNRDFIDAMVDAGTIWVSYAIETASPRLQREIGKNLNIPKVKDAIEYSASKGIIVNYWGMLGSHTETIEEAHQTMDFLEQLPPSVIPYLFALKPYPGTAAHEKMKQQEKGEETDYHNFLHLVKRNRGYAEVIDRWREAVYDPKRLRLVTGLLQKNGYSDEEIRSSYAILYKALPKEEIEDLLGGQTK